jgi:hypothetical protein
MPSQQPDNESENGAIETTRRRRARRGFELFYKFPPMVQAQGLDDVTIKVGPGELEKLCSLAENGTRMDNRELSCCLVFSLKNCTCLLIWWIIFDNLLFCDAIQSANFLESNVLTAIKQAYTSYFNVDLTKLNLFHVGTGHAFICIDGRFKVRDRWDVLFVDDVLVLFIE